MGSSTLSIEGQTSIFCITKDDNCHRDKRKYKNKKVNIFNNSYGRCCLFLTKITCATLHLEPKTFWFEIKYVKFTYQINSKVFTLPPMSLLAQYCQKKKTSSQKMLVVHHHRHHYYHMPVDFSLHLKYL